MDVNSDWTHPRLTAKEYLYTHMYYTPRISTYLVWLGAHLCYPMLYDSQKVAAAAAMHASTTLSEAVVADGTRFKWAAEVWPVGEMSIGPPGLLLRGEFGAPEGEMWIGPPGLLLRGEFGAPDPVIGDGAGAGDTAITTAGTNRRTSIMTANPLVAIAFFMLTCRTAIFSPTTIKLL